MFIRIVSDGGLVNGNQKCRIFGNETTEVSAIKVQDSRQWKCRDLSIMNLTAECTLPHKINVGKMEDRLSDPPSRIELVRQNKLGFFGV